MAISILIVDDDKLLVQKLYETVNWRFLGIGMVFTAYNIRQAQKYLEEYPIELLLCDIDMPQGSGLELLEWIRNRNMDIECAFLSSYANFAYAQKALKLSSREYLLKPISNSDLEQALLRVIEVVLEKKKNGIQSIDNRKEMFWKEILSGRFQEEQSMERALAEEIYQENDLICMDLVKIWDTPSQEEYKKEIALYDFVLNNIAAEFFREGTAQLETIVHLSDLEWMLVFRQDGDIPIAGKRFEELKTLLDKGFSRQCFIYVGKTGCFSEILRLRDELEEIERSAVPGEIGILHEKYWSRTEEDYAIPPWDVWEREMVRAGTLLSIEDNILMFVSAMGQNYLSRGCLQRFVHEFLQMVYRYLNDQELSFEQIFDGNEFERFGKRAYLSTAGLRGFIHYVFEKLNGNRQNDSRQETVIDQLKEYIDQHLSENLSRNVLAGTVYLSEDYISRIFVKMTGTSIPNYIASRRIEKAKEYISNSALPISKIALEVGYSNFSYFSKTFRDLVGCTPNEYRFRSANKKT